MKYSGLDEQEQQILKDIASGKVKSVKGSKREIVRFRTIARRTLGKSRNINIRLSERDLQKMKSLAVVKGLPYQTFISSVLHQYSNRGDE